MTIRYRICCVFRFSKSFVYEDEFGMNFLFYPERDEIRSLRRRRSVSDAQNVIRHASKTLTPGQRCVEVGAQIGSVSIAMANEVGPEGWVAALEPDPSNSFRVDQNLLLNGHMDNFCVLPFAVGPDFAVDQLTVFPSSNAWQLRGTPSDYADGYERFTINVLVKNFSEIREIANLDGVAIDLIKIDTAGFELTILNGMRAELVDRNIDRVVFEFSDLTMGNVGKSTEERLAFWEEIPYSVSEIDVNGDAEPLHLAARGNHFACVAITHQRSSHS